jgi:TolB protein
MIKHGIILIFLFAQTAGVTTAALVQERIAYIGCVVQDTEGEQIYTMSREGTDKRRLSPKHDGQAEREWLQQSPGGKYISYLSTYYLDGKSTSSFDYVSTDGLGRYSFQAPFDEDIRPAWSPAGDRIAYVEAAWASRGDIEYHHVKIYKLADKSVTPVASAIQDIGDISSLCWSPDGLKLLCAMAWVRGDGGYDIYVIDADSGKVANITKKSAYYKSLSWSKDGKKILFSSNRTGNYDVYTMNADGRSLKNITQSSEDESNPSWSPDGSRISWLRYQPNNYGDRAVSRELCITGASGALTIVVSDFFGPLLGLNSWAPDSSALLTGYTDSSGKNLALIDARTGEKTYLTNAQCTFEWDNADGIHWMSDSSGFAFQGRMYVGYSSEVIACDLRTMKLTVLTYNESLSWEGFVTPRK